MQYFFLDCLVRRSKLRELRPGRIIPGEPPAILRRGIPLAVPAPKPFVWELEPGDGDMPPMFKVPTLILRQDFVAALQEAGVDNVEYYRLVIRDPTTGESYTDYVVANIIGAVDAVDMERSEVDPESPPTTAVLFDNIVINEERCQGLKIFRPKHKLASILVSEDLKESLAAKRFSNIEFIRPEDYA
jgi:hypothetical protein